MRVWTLPWILALCCCSVLAAEEIPVEVPVTEADRSHWAYVPIRDVSPPEVKDSDWCRNPIDRFILAKLEAKDLRPLARADKATLLRRVTYDLTGLPPTPAELAAFLNDSAADAYERVVDDLLARSAYGERWGQHWLDLARFAETDGFEHDKVRPNAWRYRDWVIDALNADMPFDRFLSWQLAGDELAPDQPAARIATGFLLCGPDMPDINLQEERRHQFLNDMTGTVGSVFLGLQFGCAECHDHKYDPISHYDFYRLRAFFEGADLFGEAPIPSPEQAKLLEEFQRDKARDWKQQEAELKRLRTAEPVDEQAVQAAEKKLAEIKKRNAPEPEMGRVVRNASSRTTPRLWLRGDFRRPGPVVSASFLRVAQADMAPAPVATTGDSLSRSDLAAWLIAPENPLTLRVLVNRIWQHHFGRGIVATPSDFGLMGDSPTHPELLDWLAVEFRSLGMSFKQLHRLIVTSAAYCTASYPQQDVARQVTLESQELLWQRLMAADARNELWGRQNRQRLDGESLRDSLLAISGDLNRAAHGPGIRPPLPPDVVKTLLKNQWPVTEDTSEHTRRSIYLFVRRNLRYPFFEAFDRPDTNLSCPRRAETTIAPQALQLLNSELSVATAQKYAAHLHSQFPDNAAARIRAAFVGIFCREPTAAEMEFCQRNFNLDETSALEDLCLALFNANEFVYVD